LAKGVHPSYSRQDCDRDALSAMRFVDVSNHKGGKMGSGYVNMLEKRIMQQRKVGCEGEGLTSSLCLGITRKPL